MRGLLIKQGRCNEGDPQGRATEWADRMTGSGTIIWDSQVQQQVQSALQGTAAEGEADSGMFVFREHSEYRQYGGILGAYRPYGVPMWGGQPLMGATLKAVRRARRQGARPQAGAKGEATRQERGGIGSAGGAQTERSSFVAGSGRSGLATDAADAECWRCDRERDAVIVRPP